MKTLTINVQIQIDQFNDEDAKVYAVDTIAKINMALEREFPDVCPQIFASIDNSDITVQSEEEDHE